MGRGGTPVGTRWALIAVYRDRVKRDLLEILDELLDAWQAYHAQVIVRPRRITVTERQWALVYALTAHAYELARYLRGTLDSSSIPLAAMPTARAIFESSITACWSAHNPEGATAIGNEYGRQQNNLSESLRKVRTEVWRAAADEVADRDRDHDPSSSDAQARSIEQRAGDLVGGPDLYAMYRMMSMFSHAGIKIADEYVQPAPDNSPHPFHLRPHAEPLAEGWLSIAVCCLVWSARAVLYIAPDNVYRNHLRRLARELGTAEELQPSEAMRRRVSAGERANRRAQRP